MRVSTAFHELRRMILLAATCSVLLPRGSQGQVLEAWVARYSSPGAWDDGGHDIAVDRDGNVYVTGHAGHGFGEFQKDYVTIKYSPVGTPLWTAIYEGTGYWEEPSALALDAAGSVYVTGFSGFFGHRDYATIKYDRDGNPLWAARYDGPSSSDDFPSAIAVDSAGNVYVTGASWAMGTAHDYATIKYDPAGNQQWVSRYDGGAESSDLAHAIGVDVLGNVYVTGESFAYGAAMDYVTIKYSPDGTPLWLARYNGPRSGEDIAEILLLDGAGNLYVGGGSEGRGTSYDFATIKYDCETGEALWAARYDGPGHGPDWGGLLALDGTRHLYVAGPIADTGGFWGGAVIKYDARGNRLWTARYSGNSEYYGGWADMALDRFGNVSLVGERDGGGYQADCVTIT